MRPRIRGGEIDEMRKSLRPRYGERQGAAPSEPTGAGW
jgi:hypothetical protein